MIRLAALGKRFGGRWIFRGINGVVESGESVVLIGPSGGGKSVLLKTISGLVAPDEGAVTRSSDDIGMLFQRNALFDSLSVIDNLLFPLRERLRLTGAPARARAEAMLEAVGLRAAAELYPDEISGGMQKRLGIARTMIVNPEIVLYDEPTAGLDPITSRMIAQLILDLRRDSRGRATLVTVTNDMHRAYQLADRIFLLTNGELRAGGSPAEVRATADAELRRFVTGVADAPRPS